MLNVIVILSKNRTVKQSNIKFMLFFSHDSNVLLVICFCCDGFSVFFPWFKQPSLWQHCGCRQVIDHRGAPRRIGRAPRPEARRSPGTAGQPSSVPGPKVEKNRLKHDTNGFNMDKKTHIHKTFKKKKTQKKTCSKKM